MADLRLIVLCGRSPRHLYVANRLLREFEVVAIVHETGARWTAAHLAKLLRPRALLNKTARWLRDRKRYRGGREHRFFFGEQPARLDRADLVYEVPHINHESVVKLIDRLRPDAIAVFGTSLIRQPLLSRGGKHGILNLHGGLSPEYRGADCTFWALYNGEPDKVGCTLHFIDAGIDTGKLIAHVCPEVAEGDDELTLFWRAVHDSAEVYVEALRRLARGDRLGRSQSGKGRLYQVKQRLGRHEAELAKRLNEGMLRGVKLSRRVTWFEPPVQSISAGAGAPP